MQVDPKRLTAGFTRANRGMNSGRAASLIGDDQLAFAVNATMRDGYPRTRPGFQKLPLRFAEAEAGQWCMTKRFQGARWYDDLHDAEKIICSVGGRIFLVEPLQQFLVTEITPRKATSTLAGFTTVFNGTSTVTLASVEGVYLDYPIWIDGKRYAVTAIAGNSVTLVTRELAGGISVNSGAIVSVLDVNSSERPMAWMEQAEQYMVIQDGQSLPLIYDGLACRRALVGIEVPVGTVMAYGDGRLWVAINEREFVGGDIAGGPTGVLGFTENNFMSGGGAFRTLANSGKIRAMEFVANLDTSLGQGPLQVLTERAIYSVNAPTEREVWAIMTNPIKTVSLINYGAMSANGTLVVNGDLFFRAYDGLRSFVMARREFGSWGNTPISREMKSVMDKDTKALLAYSSAVLFDNRLLFTFNPLPGENGVRHRGLIALDFEPLNSMGEDGNPAYDGCWTAFEPYQLVQGVFNGVERCFAFAASSDHSLELWEISTDARFDNRTARIASAVEYAAVTFGSENNAKNLKNGEASVSRAAGMVDLTLSYRPDQHPLWQPWNTHSLCVTHEDCETEAGCKTLTEYHEGHVTPIGFGMPPDGCNTLDKKPMRRGYEFLVRLAWTGFAEIRRLALHAQDVDEPPAAPCRDRSDCRALSGCNPDPFLYRPGCAALQRPLIVNAGDGTIAVSWWAEAGVTYSLRRIYDAGLGSADTVVATYVVTLAEWRTETFDAGVTDGQAAIYYLSASGAGCPDRASEQTAITLAG